MTLDLYYTSSDNEEVTKSLTLVQTLSNVHPFEETSVEEPVLKIGSLQLSSLEGCNYAYISEFGRYYYVGKPTLLHDGTYKIKLTVDVLMSFATGIRALEAVISRQENQYNLYLPDPEFKVYANTDKKTLRFSSVPFTKTPNFLLTVSGGS